MSSTPIQDKKLLKSDKARMEFFLLWGSGVLYLEGIILSSRIWKCLQNSIPLHFPSPKGEINLVFLSASISMDSPCGHPQGRSSLLQRVWGRLLPVCFAANIPGWHVLLDRSSTFDLLRKSLYCLLQKCPEAASSPKRDFKHMMAIYLFSVLSNSFSFLWFGTGERAEPEWPWLAIHYPVELY